MAEQEKEKKVEVKDVLNRELGKLKEKLPNGMWITDKEEKVPAFPGLKKGDKISLANGEFSIPEKKETKAKGADVVSRKEFEEEKAKREALESKIGEKGSDIKVPGDANDKK